MGSRELANELTYFGLTRQESLIYECLLKEGKISGYEVAKQLGISRSNAYGSLASMTDKGAAYLVLEGTTKKYIPIPLEEFLKNHMNELNERKTWLLHHSPVEKEHTEGYATIEGENNIICKMKNLMDNAQERVYLSCTRNSILLFIRELNRLMEANKKVVILTDYNVTIGNAKIYVGRQRGSEIGLIADSKYVITGEYGDDSNNTCLYSGQKNFVEVYKRSLSNEIELLRIKEEANLKEKGED